MSSAEPRAAATTAWQRSILDELGAPPAGLARLTPRGTGTGRGAPATAAARSGLPAAERTTFDPSPPPEPAGGAPALPTAEQTAFDARAGRPPATGHRLPPQRPDGGSSPSWHDRPPNETVFDPPPGAWQPGGASPPTAPRPEAARPRGPALPTAPRPVTSPAQDRPWESGAPGARVRRTPGSPHPPSAGPHPESLLRRSRHGDPMVRRVAREIRKVTGASQDAYRDATLADAVQQPVTTGRRIAVTGIRGGAGKSVVSALMATAMAHFRQDRVLALDADPGIGSLMLRLGMTGAPSLHRLVTSGADPASFDAVRAYLAQTDAGVWALGGTDDRFGEVNLASYRAATNLLGRFFGVTVIDCGAGLTGELPEGVLSDAHSQVMVTPATPDGVLSARRALELLATDRPELASRTTVVLAAHAAGAGVDPDRALATMPPWCRRVEYLAYDRHLADGSLIDPARLAEPTRVAALRIAGTALTLAAGRSLPQ